MDLTIVIYDEFYSVTLRYCLDGFTKKYGKYFCTI